MTALRPATRWFDHGWGHTHSRWKSFKQYLYDKNLSRSVGTNHYNWKTDEYIDVHESVMQFTDDYFDISTQTSFVDAEWLADEMILGDLGFYDGISYNSRIELRHFWICGAVDIRKGYKTTSYWRDAHWYRGTNNPRLLELIDSNDNK